MSFIYPPALKDDEKLVLSAAATRYRSGSLPTGGRLFLTTERLVHRRSLTARLRRAHSWECPLLDVVTVELGGRSLTQMGGAGQLVSVTTSAGEQVGFRVWMGKRMTAHILQQRDAARREHP